MYSNTYQLLDLVPESNHTFSVMAYSEAGWSDRSPTTTLSTSEGEPPEKCSPPYRGYSTAYSNVTAFSLSWYAPRSYGYPVLKFDLLVNNVTSPPGDLFEFGYQTSYNYLCGGLQGQNLGACAPDTTYEFQIRAWNQEGPGEWSNVKYLSTAPIRPPQTPYAPKERKINDYWSARGADQHLPTRIPHPPPPPASPAPHPHPRHSPRQVGEDDDHPLVVRDRRRRATRNVAVVRHARRATAQVRERERV